MIADYYFIRRKQLSVTDLYSETGQYRYSGGYNLSAVLALLAGILPNIPGFLLQVKAVGEGTFPGWVTALYHYAWFVGFAVSAFVYYIAMKGRGR